MLIDFNPLLFITFLILSFLYGSLTYSSQLLDNIDPQKNLPIKLDIEVTRSHNFLKVAVFLKNLSSTPQFLNLQLTIYKMSNGNLSKVIQAKELYLQAYELALPFIAEFLVNTYDNYKITLQIFDKEGNLLYVKNLDSKAI